MNLTDSTLQAFKDHCIAEFPREACGIVVEGQFISMANTSENPLEEFDFDRRAFVKYGNKLEAILHSHPSVMGEVRRWPVEWPSSHDVQAHIDTGKVYGIIGTDGESFTQMVWLDDNNRAPLEGRPFVSGVWDCYASVRDWLLEHKGIRIPNYARGMEWWKGRTARPAEDLFTTNFKNSGWVEVPMNQMQIGDGLLIKYGSRVINHCAVFTGANQIFHHGYHPTAVMLSGYDDISTWLPHIQKVVRYMGKGNDNG